MHQTFTECDFSITDDKKFKRLGVIWGNDFHKEFYENLPAS
jgi:hypothetical protein